jgi:hypothetical protein
MTEEHFIDKLRYIFAEYFPNDEKMWDAIYEMTMHEFYMNRAWKLKSKMRWKKNVESVGSK